jgi:hypothetical protein
MLIITPLETGVSALIYDLLSTAALSVVVAAVPWPTAGRFRDNRLGDRTGDTS